MRQLNDYKLLFKCLYDEQCCSFATPSLYTKKKREKNFHFSNEHNSPPENFDEF